MDGNDYKAYFTHSRIGLPDLLAVVNRLVAEGNHLERIYGPSSLLNVWTAIMYVWENPYEGPMEPPEEEEPITESMEDK